jgi:uncharacterized protein (TIGR01777 family)
MRVLISGASGLIGRALSDSLSRDGHEPVALVRREPARKGEFRWDPAQQVIDSNAFDGVDAVVNLAGAPVAGRRWSSSYQRQIRTSRIDSTTTLVTALVDAVGNGGPHTLISGSAVGYYGPDTQDATLDESAAAGAGFLAGVTVDWEHATAPATRVGVRVACVRTGIVLARKGGALGTVLPLFKLGVAGRLGSGRQWMSWISLADEVAAIRWLLEHDDITGPVNLTAPHPVTNADYTRAVGAALHRPTVVPVPATALRLALGDLADEGALASQKIAPRRLLDSGFRFSHEHLDDALAAIMS